MKCFRPLAQGIGGSFRQFARTVSFLSLVLLIPAFSVPAVPTAVPAAAVSPKSLPSEFGEVIFHAPGERGKHLFIIGQSHRSAISGANGSHTVRTQAEIFRIGEWLIREENIRLLLPEGFFRKSPSVAVQKAGFGDLSGITLDNQTLEAKLADTNVFINADILLKSSYPIHLQQVEDADIYRSVGSFLRLASEADSINAPLIDMELSFLQEIRSAAMLQNAPAAIEKEFAMGNIDSRRAIFTIGMAHVDEIVRFLRDGRIAIKAPPLAASYQDLDAAVEVIRQGYGVTVILPRTLIDDQEVMRMANLGGSI